MIIGAALRRGSILPMFSDLRFAFRQLARNPGFSLIAILSLAVGIGATTSVFSIINGALLKPRPYRQPEELVFLTAEKLAGGISNASISGKQFDEWEKQTKSLAGLAVYDWTFNFLVHPDGNESIEGMLGSAALFNVLGVQPILGRAFTPAERTARDHPVVILGYELWQRRFAADPNVVGKVVTISRLPPLTVIGVMPPDMRFLPSRGGAQEPNYNLHAHVDYWLPSAVDSESRSRRWNVVARLKSGVSLQQARAEFATIAAAQTQSDAELNGITIAVTPVGDVLDGELRRIVLPLFGAVCFVLFVAAANVTSLLLVRGLGRQRELAVRTALGAGWARLLRLALTESLLLASLGGLLGTGLAFATTKLLILAAPNSIPRLDAVTLDLRVLGFAVGVSLLAGLSSGALAAWQVVRPDVNQALKAGPRGGTQGSAGRRVLGALVAGEVALTFTLLIGAGLMLQTMIRLTRVKPGYDTDPIVTMVVTTLGSNPREFHQEALERVAALPGVKSAAFAWGVPLTGNHWKAAIQIEGRPAPASLKDRIIVPLRSVSSDYFQLMGVALRQGRLFAASDRAESPRVAIINEDMARRHFPGENPVGRQLSLAPDRKLEIVGIIADLRNTALNGPVEPEVYLAFSQNGAFSKHLVVRTAIDPLGVVASVRQELQRVDAGVVVEKVKTMEHIRDESIAAQRFAMTLISAFSIVALVLAIVGVFGVMSHAVVQRSHEIGVRMAIGAQRSHVLSLILRQGMLLAGIGIVLGVAGALAVTGVLRSLLFEVSPTDLLTFGSIAVLLVVVTALACWIPARRATKIDPLAVLRSE